MLNITVILEFVVHHSQSVEAEGGSHWVFEDPGTEEEALVEFNSFLVVLFLFVEVA